MGVVDMKTAHSGDPLDDPRYLRAESQRLREIIATLGDPEIKKELATHSLYLAQRAEAIARVAEDPVVIRMNVERYRSMLASDLPEGERRTVEDLLDQAERALDGPQTLRDLASWYRGFAERTDNPAIWEARLHMAEDLEAEAERTVRRQSRSDPPHGFGPTGA
jgi:hypothetical protein